ncbi:MAG: hypothetical protein OXT74_12605 [Candidatus Poribacteria bacterium]|nr:hypothetical protein [Candidatus Poribacteria bacterium]
MERLISIIIVVGALIWLAGVLVFDGRWQWQMFAAAVIIVGIIAAHIWEEVYQHKDEEE